jgi:hypothetical protein
MIHKCSLDVFNNDKIVIVFKNGYRTFLELQKKNQSMNRYHGSTKKIIEIVSRCDRGKIIGSEGCEG